ncbi:MAG: zinc-ribbon domain-containing protein [Gemmataceae bacterium]|nr:zinc-ribbon domain-containing protein [Gemmataceae bacterium]
MLIFCPDCQRQLRVPDSAAGKQVKCPACQKIFAAGAAASGEEIQAPRGSLPAAPPPPDSFDEDEPRPRHSRRFDGDDLDDREQYIFRGGGDEAQRRANAGAVWLYVAGGITIFVWLANTLMTIALGGFENLPFGGHDRDAFLAGMICGLVGCGALIVAMNILLFVAGFQLKSFGVKGWVVTGIVLAFAQTLLFGAGVLINLIYLVTDTRAALDDWAPLTVILSGSATVLNSFAGIKAIVVLNNEAVSAEFDQRKPRRRKRRRRAEW